MRTLRIPFLLASILPFLALGAVAGEIERIDLPAPDMEGGAPLMKALSLRHTSRSFSEEPLPLHVLSDLLWAASGINRPASGKRTAPTARNWQEIDIYVTMEDGLYLYDPEDHALVPVLAADIRGATGRQEFPARAPVNLVYVSDYDRMGDIPLESKKFYSATDTGFIAQNVYLFCASSGLSTVVRGAVDREALEKAMRLPPERHVVLAHTVGYPGE